VSSRLCGIGSQRGPQRPEEHDRLQEELLDFMQKWEKLQSELAAMQLAAGT
jgi:hypothetical protein